MRLPPEVVNRIKELLKDARIAQYRIAAQCGVALSTVNRIANGKAHSDKPQPPKPPIQGVYVPTDEVAYCEECGVDVKQPCLKCWLKTQRK